MTDPGPAPTGPGAARRELPRSVALTIVHSAGITGVGGRTAAAVRFVGRVGRAAPT